MDRVEAGHKRLALRPLKLKVLGVRAVEPVGLQRPAAHGVAALDVKDVVRVAELDRAIAVLALTDIELLRLALVALVLADRELSVGGGVRDVERPARLVVDDRVEALAERRDDKFLLSFAGKVFQDKTCVGRDAGRDRPGDGLVLFGLDRVDAGLKGRVGRRALGVERGLCVLLLERLIGLPGQRLRVLAIAGGCVLAGKLCLFVIGRLLTGQRHICTCARVLTGQSCILAAGRLLTGQPRTLTCGHISQAV